MNSSSMTVLGVTMSGKLFLGLVIAGCALLAAIFVIIHERIKEG
jgi:hypothetical protein